MRLIAYIMLLVLLLATCLFDCLNLTYKDVTGFDISYYYYNIM